MNDREQQALDFIQSFSQGPGWPPSVREVRDHMGFKSTSTAQILIAELAHKGLLFKGQGSRQIRVTR